MRKRIPKILVTGGAGFIGSAFVRLVIGDSSVIARRVAPKQSILKVIIVDKLTYAGDLKRLYWEGTPCAAECPLPNYSGTIPFFKIDICNKKRIEAIFSKEKPDIIVHFAAESHVDRSIDDATPFIDTNIKGTQVLLDLSRKYKVGKFIHISTDEVYGEIANGKFSENSLIKPNSPYAATKAAADLLVQSYIRTYKFPAIIIRPSNNYGPWQYPEKLIPLSVLKILVGLNIPVYGKGLNVREWLYVDDCAAGILKIMQKGKIGEIYNLGSGQESKNIDTVRLLLKTLRVSQDRFEFVKDRLGHDLRYSLNSNKLAQELGWKAQIKLSEGLRLTVAWSLKYAPWLKSKLGDINKLYNK